MRQAEGESRDDVLAYARRCRCGVTLSQLRRYQQNGLIPKPRQVGLGRARGTLVMYPTGTGRQLVAAREALRDRRSLRLVRWQLWWEGYEIDPAHIRGDLARLLGRGKDSEKLPREVRRRLNPQQQKLFEAIIRDMKAGSPGNSAEAIDEKVLARAFGIDREMMADMNKPSYWPQPGLMNQLQGFFKVINSGALQDALASATDADLSAAREEVRNLFEWAGTLFQLPLLPVKTVISQISRILADPGVSGQQTLLLAWLSARRFVVARQAYETLGRICSKEMLAKIKQNTEKDLSWSQPK